MTLPVGSRIGPYEVLAAIGAGGMGEVYRARDIKLNRDVAIKVLPSAVAGDGDRLARFHREAQLLATLNHPNIAHIHGLEDSTGIPALVMEFVDGDTLADRVAGGLPVGKALAIAREIARGLEAAHAANVVHRDLKPANVKIRQDGAVKILDFGLAKALDPAAPPSGLSQAETMTSPAMMTQAGVILGTAAYMSPEQARGKPVDKRSDIWAFGCVLYEMLTGRTAFGADTVPESLGRILEREPDWSALPSATPERSERASTTLPPEGSGAASPRHRRRAARARRGPCASRVSTTHGRRPEAGRCRSRPCARGCSDPRRSHVA
jgi:serine/threonine protein kinase